MPDVSSITLPDNNTYSFKDSTARGSLEDYKESLGQAGIVNTTYTTILDTQTVTTVSQNTGFPLVKLSSTADLIKYSYTVRVTFDNVEYIVPCELWASFIRGTNPVAFAGNATLWGTITGFVGEQNSDLPFLITSGIDNYTNNRFVTGLYLFTPTAGSYSIKIELVQYTYSKLPSEVVCGQNHLPIYMLDSTGTGYTISAGPNIMQNLDDTIAIGLNNTVSASRAIAIGRNNTSSGQVALALGTANTSSGQYAVTLGISNTSSGLASTAMGNQSTASGSVSFALGMGCSATGIAQHVTGMWNVPDTVDSNGVGEYIEIVGNGSTSNAKSNARTLDWSGNESLAGGITLGKGTQNETSLTAAQLNQLLALSASIPTQASIDANGLITFKNSSNAALFTLQLPIYNGGVS